MYEDVKPDMIIIGKALSGGYYPISAVLASRKIMGVLNPGDHGSTFGGNPLACAIAREALKVLIEEGLVERSAELGVYLAEKMRTLRSSRIKEVRGRGLWIGVELTVSARPYCEALMEAGILCKETHDHVIRISPPLVINQEELDWAFERLQKVLTQ
jgi:ornithine--oxo-acid transaminase